MAETLRFAPFSLEEPEAGLACPGPGELHLWSVRVDHVAEEDWGRLDERERTRAERLLVEDKRVQQVASRSALRLLLGRYLGRDARELRFDYGENDKPCLDGGELSFNLSHSGPWAVVAVAREGRLGVDVEGAREGRGFLQIARNFFHPDERAYLAGLPEGDRSGAFYRAWTRKEAYLKAWGTGLSFASSRFCIDYSAGQAGRVLSTEMPGDRGEHWSFVDLEVEAGFPAAACWDSEPTRVRARSLRR